MVITCSYIFNVRTYETMPFKWRDLSYKSIKSTCHEVPSSLMCVYICSSIRNGDKWGDEVSSHARIITRLFLCIIKFAVCRLRLTSLHSFANWYWFNHFWRLLFIAHSLQANALIILYLTISYNTYWHTLHTFNIIYSIRLWYSIRIINNREYMIQTRWNWILLIHLQLM